MKINHNIFKLLNYVGLSRFIKDGVTVNVPTSELVELAKKKYVFPKAHVRTLVNV